MIQNYLLIALRNLRKNSTYSLLNVLGLGLSVACCILIFLLVQHHLSYDTFHQKADRTIRLVTDIQLETVTPFRGTPNPMSKALRSEFAFLEKTAMCAGRNEALISVPNGSGVPDKYKEEGKLAFAEPEFLEILDFPLLHGDHASFREPNTALISEKMARKYYATADAIGKTFRYDNEVDFRVVGILRDLPPNTEYNSEILLSWSSRNTMPEYAPYLDNWGGINSDTYCFAVLQEGHSIEEMHAAMPAFRKKYRHPDSDLLFQYKALPIKAIHLNKDYGTGIDQSFLWALGFIGLFLLITACVNFINMATAQALKRAREVGVRKSLGSTRGQLFWQFMFETSLIVVAAVIIGTLMARISLPYLNSWLEDNIQFTGPGLWQLAGFILGISVIVIFLAGAYPGLVQARFQAVVSLKGLNDKQSAGGFSLRRVLVATQFTISQILIIGAAVVTAQIQFAQRAEWGFRPEVVLTLPIPEQANMKTMREQLAGLAGVKNISLCYQPPASTSNNQTGVTYENRTEGEPWMVNKKPADTHYLETFGLQLLAGRNLQPSDTVREFLINETFVKKLNLASAEEVIDKKATIDGVDGTIVGVIKDFHNWGLQESISAIAISTESESYSTCALELQPGDPAPVLAQIKKIWENNYPDYYYEHTFMDDRMAEFLQTENVFMRLIRIFAGIAVFIGCLGLYGLSAFMVLRKTKEIGIRKTLGATVPGVLWMFGKEYIRLIIIAFILAAPIGWWAMNTWLQDYEYRTPLGPGIFGIALLATFLVAFLTVGLQSMRAALANPVKSLRSE